MMKKIKAELTHPECIKQHPGHSCRNTPWNKIEQLNSTEKTRLFLGDNLTKLNNDYFETITKIITGNINNMYNRRLILLSSENVAPSVPVASSTYND